MDLWGKLLVIDVGFFGIAFLVALYSLAVSVGSTDLDEIKAATRTGAISILVMMVTAAPLVIWYAIVFIDWIFKNG